MSTMISNDFPQLSKFAFWDIDLSRMDFAKYADFAIIRVFERGTMDDIKQIIGYYGEQRVIRSLTTATTLLPRAVKLGELLFGLSRNQFACSSTSQSAMTYSKY